MQTIVIDPVTRIEGHAKISIHLDDDGQVYRMAGSGKTGWTPLVMARLKSITEATNNRKGSEKPWEKRKRLGEERKAAREAELGVPPSVTEQPMP